MQEATNEELLAELQGLIGFGLKMLQRGAEIYRELQARRVEVRLVHAGLLFGQFLPAIAAGKLSAHAVVALNDQPRLLQLVAKLDLQEQERLVGGQEVPIVTTLDQPPVPMTIKDAYAAGHRHFLVGAHLLSPAQQIVQLQAAAKRKPKAKEPPVADPPSEDEIAALSQEILRVLATRGGAKLTPRLAAEVAYNFGWRVRR